jgi:hypothetical protein
MSTTPIPDTVFAVLWESDFDLLRTAQTLDLPLTALLALLKDPGYADPLDQLHRLSRQLLDLRAARSITAALDLLESAAARTDNPAERRRIAAEITRAANAAARLTRASRATDRRSGRSVPDAPATAKKPATSAAVPAAARAASAPATEPPHVELPPEHPDNIPEELKAPYAKVWKAAHAYYAAKPPQITLEQYTQAFNEWEAIYAAYHARCAAAQAAQTTPK